MEEISGLSKEKICEMKIAQIFLFQISIKNILGGLFLQDRITKRNEEIEHFVSDKNLRLSTNRFRLSFFFDILETKNSGRMQYERQMLWERKNLEKYNPDTKGKYFIKAKEDYTRLRNLQENRQLQVPDKMEMLSNWDFQVLVNSKAFVHH